MDVQVISMVSSPQRRTTIADHLSAVGLPFRFFDAVDGRAGGVAQHFVCRPDFPLRAYTYRDRPVDAGELACTLSHMRAIRRAWAQGVRGPMVILEDDALLCGPLDILSAILERAPKDAAYVQLALTPTATITQLAEYAQQGGGLFTPKCGPITVQLPDTTAGCHCTAGYIITPIGMRAIAEMWFEGDCAIFPCAEAELAHNVALVADRLLYQAAVSQGGVGYVCNVPLVTTTAQESTLHPDHGAWHAEARDAALSWFAALAPLVAQPSA